MFIWKILTVVLFCISSSSQKRYDSLDHVSKIGVGHNTLSLPFDYGTTLLLWLQNPGIKEMLVSSVSAGCGTEIKWFFENLSNITDDGMWALKMTIHILYLHPWTLKEGRAKLERRYGDGLGHPLHFSLTNHLSHNILFEAKKVSEILNNFNLISIESVGKIKQFFFGLRHKHLPAILKHRPDYFDVVDATTKIPSGILKLNLGDWMGSFDECLEIESKKRGIKGNYCLGTMYITIDPFEFLTDDILKHKAKLFAESKATFQNAYPTATYPSLGLCIPNGCSADDLQLVVELLNLPFPMPFECQTVDQANPPMTNIAWGVISFFIFIILLMTLSTAYDVYCQSNKKEPSHVLLNSFSVYTNGKKLFKINKYATELSCLNGIRVLSMIWVIAGHSLSVTVTGPVVNALDVLKFLDELKSMVFASAVHSVDTFMMITGLLVVYGYFKSKHMGLKFNIFVFYLHRYVRLTPPFLGVILVSMSLLQYLGSGPHWSFIVNYFQNFCQKSWWSALLYFQNYINVDQWCIGQTWYLNIDWQLYLLAPVFLLPLGWKPKLGLPMLLLALITFIVIPFYVTWVNELPSMVTNLYGNTQGFQNLYYLRTHTRASSWFVGALVGYAIAKVKFDNTKIKLNRVVLLLVWAVFLALLNMCVFIGHDVLRAKEYHKYGNAFYNSLVRPLWATCIGWIAFACSTGYGGVINKFLSLPIFQVLNRFTYSIYLLHVTMLYMKIYASKTPAYFSIFEVAYSFWGICMLALALSVFWVLAFESPVIVIEKYLLDGYKKKRAQETNRDI